MTLKEDENPSSKKVSGIFNEAITYGNVSDVSDKAELTPPFGFARQSWRGDFVRLNLMLSFLSKKTEDTIRLGKRLAGFLKKGDIVCLFGDLGSGKTTFTKGIAKGFKINEAAVNSPSFILMNQYVGRLPLFHFDLYRIDNAKEIFSIGYEEFLYDDGVAVVEWAERLGVLLPKNYLKVEFTHRGKNERLIKFFSVGSRAENIIAKLKR